MSTSNKIIKNHMQANKVFDRLAWMYDFEKYFSSPLRKKAANFVNLKPPKKILDVATGTGAQAYALAKLGFDVTGIDLSTRMLDQARKKFDSSLKLKFLQGDATNLPFKDSSFDAVSISLALHDMPYEIELLALKEMKRVAKKGGKILVVDYMEPAKGWLAKFIHPIILLYETKNYLPYTKKGLEDLLKEVNLKIYKETNFLKLVRIGLINNSK